MKKLYALFLTLVLIFTLIACNDTNDKNKTEANENSTAFVSEDTSEENKTEANETSTTFVSEDTNEENETEANETSTAFVSEDTNEENETEVNEPDVVFVYVAAVTENGFVGSVNDLGHVFVEYSDNDTLIELFDTVYVKYNKENLEERQGTFTHITGSEDTYQYVIKDPITVRQSDPSKGEPLYG